MEKQWISCEDSVLSSSYLGSFAAEISWVIWWVRKGL